MAIPIMTRPMAMRTHTTRLIIPAIMPPCDKTISERNLAQGKKRDKNESNRNQKNNSERDVRFHPHSSENENRFPDCGNQVFVIENNCRKSKYRNQVETDCEGTYGDPKKRTDYGPAGNGSLMIPCPGQPFPECH